MIYDEINMIVQQMYQIYCTIATCTTRDNTPSDDYALMFLSVADHQAKPIAMHIEDLDGRIILHVFSQFADENIHATGGKIAFLPPDRAEGKLAWQDHVAMLAQHPEQISLFR